LGGGGVGGGGGGGVPNCSRGGKKLRSNITVKLNIDVEDVDDDGFMDVDDDGVMDGDGDGDEDGDGDGCEDGDGDGCEDGDWDGDGEDKTFDQTDEWSNGNKENSSRPIQPVARPILEMQVLSTATIHLLSTLAGSCRAVTSSTSTIFNNATDVLTSLTTGHSQDLIQSSIQANTLLAIAKRCDISEKLVESSQFILSLNLIQFRTKIES